MPANTGPPVARPIASSDVSVAQHDSEDAYRSAAQAEAYARTQAEAADRAEQNAVEKQNEAQTAQQQALQLRHTAEEAQRNASEVGRVAARRAESSQARAEQDQPRAQLQSAQGSSPATTSGTIERAGQDELVIERDNAPALRLRIDAQTTVSEHGQPAQLDSLKQGTPVNVSYRMERDQPIAQTIDAGSAPAQADAQP
jgi:hypothetical protein